MVALGASPENDSDPKVLFRSGPLRGNVLALDQGRTSFGRDTRNQVAIHDDIISSFHAAIIRESDGCYLEDAGSKNGTFLNGERVTRAKLKDGDVICLCQSGPELLFTLGTPALPTVLESTTGTYSRTRSLLSALKELLPGSKRDPSKLMTLTGVRRILDYQLEESARRSRRFFLGSLAAMIVLCLGGFTALALILRREGAGSGVIAADREILLPPPDVSLELQLEPIYGSFFLSYREAPVGEALIVNRGRETLEKAQLDLQFEGDASRLLVLPWSLPLERLAPGASQGVPLRLMLSTDVLSSHPREVTAKLSLSVPGHRSVTVSRLLFIHPREVFTWSKPERIAAFIDPGDPAVKELVRIVWDLMPMVSKEECPPPRLVAAFTLLTALSHLGVRYLPDATQPISQRVDSGANDSVNFPGQTILGRTGDCDDLAVAGCALLEAAAIPCAFAIGTGHVFLLFDVGLPPDALAESPFDLETVLVWKGRVWLPVETTELARPGGSFAAAWAAAWPHLKAAAAGQVTLVELAEAWKSFQPMNPPPSAEIQARLAELPRVREGLVHQLETGLETLRKLFGENLSRRIEQISSDTPPGLERDQAIGLLYARSGLFLEARRVFERALFAGQPPPDVAGIRQWCQRASEELAVMLVHLSLCLSLGARSARDQDVAALYGELALERLPTLVPTERGELMLRLALIHRQRGDLSAERTWSQRAFATDPALADTYRRMVAGGGPVAGPVESVRDFLRLGLVRRRGQ